MRSLVSSAWRRPRIASTAASAPPPPATPSACARFDSTTAWPKVLSALEVTCRRPSLGIERMLRVRSECDQRTTRGNRRAIGGPPKGKQAFSYSSRASATIVGIIGHQRQAPSRTRRGLWRRRQADRGGRRGRPHGQNAADRRASRAAPLPTADRVEGGAHPQKVLKRCIKVLNGAKWCSMVLKGRLSSLKSSSKGASHFGNRVEGIADRAAGNGAAAQ